MRPRLKPRLPINSAIAELRVSLGETQLAFSRRMEVQPTSVARWETSHQPDRKFLERLLKLARQQNHPSAKEFAQALQDWWGEELRQSKEERLAQITNKDNLRDAELLLRRIWMIVTEAPPEDGGTAENYEEQLRRIGEGLLALADHISIDGRLDLFKQRLWIPEKKK
jgi:transcriptional regulator with XRE-family HTH domain